jgi:hypothetical protein
MLSTTSRRVPTMVVALTRCPTTTTPRPYVYLRPLEWQSSLHHTLFLSFLKPRAATSAALRRPKSRRLALRRSRILQAPIRGATRIPTNRLPARRLSPIRQVRFEATALGLILRLHALRRSRILQAPIRGATRNSTNPLRVRHRSLIQNVPLRAMALNTTSSLRSRCRSFILRASTKTATLPRTKAGPTSDPFPSNVHTGCLTMNSPVCTQSSQIPVHLMPLVACCKRGMCSTSPSAVKRLRLKD